jgi:hypothetical protein
MRAGFRVPPNIRRLLVELLPADRLHIVGPSSDEPEQVRAGPREGEGRSIAFSRALNGAAPMLLRRRMCQAARELSGQAR